MSRADWPGSLPMRRRFWCRTGNCQGIRNKNAGFRAVDAAPPATSRSSLESAPLEVLVAEASTLNLRGLQGLIDALRGRGYRVMGPTVRNGAIIIDEVLSIDDLPRGVGDEQDAGTTA